MITSQDTLGALATSYPAATPIFLRYRLDFCCGGRETLAAACEAAGVAPATVIAEINALGADAADDTPDWTQRTPNELIDHVVNTFHAAHRIDLPAVVKAARRVELVHGGKASCPHGLADHLEQMRSELLAHMKKEEELLFPALRTGRRGQAVQMPIQMMMREHDDHGVAVRRVRELTADLTPPAEACRTWRALYVSLERLEAELMQHIHLENNVLFSRALGA